MKSRSTERLTGSESDQAGHWSKIHKKISLPTTQFYIINKKTNHANIYDNKGEKIIGYEMIIGM